MKKALSVFLILFSSLVNFAQENQFHYMMDVDTTRVGLHGIAVDPDGKIWYAAHDDSLGITVLNSDLTPASFSPVTSVTIDGETHSILTKCKGMELDHEGNIVIIMNSIELYRINYKTGEGMTFANLQTATESEKGSFTKPGIDSEGNVYIGSVVTDEAAPNPIWKLDSNFELVGNAVEVQPNWSRTVEVSQDGKELFMGGLWGTVFFHFHSDDLFIYELDESFPVPDLGFGGAVSSINYDNDGNLWISDEGYNIYWVYDFNASTYTQVGDVNDPIMNLPRGAGVSVTGDTVYVVNFGGAVQMWAKGTPPPQPATSLFDDFEDADTVNAWTGSWGTFDDGGGATTIAYEITGDDGYNNSLYSLHTTGQFGAFGGVVGLFNQEGTELNLEGTYTGIAFAAKGEAVDVRVRVRELKAESERGYAYFGKIFTPTPEWTFYVIPFDSLNPQYGDPIPPFDATDLYAIDFGPAAAQTDIDVYIDDIYFWAVNPPTSVEEKDIENIPAGYTLSQNYPNPFNPSTIIDFSIPQSGLVSLKIYDLLGREITTLVNEYMNIGNYSVDFSAFALSNRNGDLSSGVYFYVLKSRGYSLMKKMILLK